MNMTRQDPALSLGQATQFAQSAWASARVTKRLDSEMAMLLRSHLHFVFESAADWLDLSARLKDHGYYLKRYGSGTMICDSHSHVEICRCGFLGYPTAELSERFGKRPG